MFFKWEILIGKTHRKKSYREKKKWKQRLVDRREGKKGTQFGLHYTVPETNENILLCAIKIESFYFSWREKDRQTDRQIQRAC